MWANQEKKSKAKHEIALQHNDRSPALKICTL
jgi:hypothetical protein